MKYEWIWNVYPCWIIYLAQLSKFSLLKQRAELTSLAHSLASLVSPAHHLHSCLQRDIGLSLLQWPELPLASGLALGIRSHGILCTNGWKKNVESRQLSTLLLLLWGSGRCALRRVKAFIHGSCAGVLWESEPHTYLGFGAQLHVVSNASIQC